MIILLISLKILSGDIIKRLKENGYEYTWGNVTVKLAEAYGFCWGVERAVQIAYEARKQFPDEKIWITNEILHSPSINKVLKKQNQYFFYNIFNLNIFAALLFVKLVIYSFSWLWIVKSISVLMKLLRSLFQSRFDSFITIF